jgi:hypothetical protein
MRMALLGVGAVGALFCLGGCLVWGARVALSIGIGAAIAAANLYVLAQIVASMIGVTGDRGVSPGQARAGEEPAPAQGNAGAWGVVAFFKMNALIAGVWYLMTKGLVAPIPLVFGYGSLPIGIAIGSLVSDKTTREPSHKPNPS